MKTKTKKTIAYILSFIFMVAIFCICDYFWFQQMPGFDNRSYNIGFFSSSIIMLYFGITGYIITNRFE